jgi:Lrp/AsnC family leucine-responsive transcriptional regulator
MTLQNDVLLDDIGWQILQELQKNARLTFREIGGRVNLSAPAVAERVRRMEEAGIIRGYRLDLDLAKVGLPVTAFIRMSVPKEMRQSISLHLQAIPEVLECYRVAGAESFIIKVASPSVQHLENIIDSISHYGHSTTSIVLSVTIANNTIQKIEDE